MAEPSPSGPPRVEDGGLSAQRTPQGTRVPLGRTKTSHYTPKDIVAELAAARDVDPRTFVPLRREGMMQLQQFYPLIRNAEDLKNAPQTLKRSEFGFSPLFCPDSIDLTCQAGLFPMSIDFGFNTFLFTPKLHKDRSVSLLPSWNPPPGTRKLAKRCDVFVNRGADYPHVAQMIYDQHGENWMCAPLRRCFYFMFNNREKFSTQIVCIAIRLKDNRSGSGSSPLSGSGAEGELIACELGYIVGDIYTSLTGAYTMNGAGTLQLAVTGLLMRKLGVRVWDLGMAMKYKTDALHAVDIPRKRWLELVARRTELAGALDKREERAAAEPEDGAADVDLRGIMNMPFIFSWSFVTHMSSKVAAVDLHSPRNPHALQSPEFNHDQRLRPFSTPTPQGTPLVTLDKPPEDPNKGIELSKNQMKKLKKQELVAQKKHHRKHEGSGDSPAAGAISSPQGH